MTHLAIDPDSPLLDPRPRTAEECLMLAVFERAVRDFLAIPLPAEKCTGGYAGTSPQDKREAERYLFCDSCLHDGPFSLGEFAVHFGMDVGTLRNRVRRLASGEAVLPRKIR